MISPHLPFFHLMIIAFAVLDGVFFGCSKMVVKIEEQPDKVSCMTIIGV